MRGTANEATVMEFLRRLPLVTALYDVGMPALVQHPHLACSPDAVALVK